MRQEMRTKSFEQDSYRIPSTDYGPRTTDHGPRTTDYRVLGYHGTSEEMA